MIHDDDAGMPPLQMQKSFPTAEATDKYFTNYVNGYIENYEKTFLIPLDANNELYQVDASRNYNPEPKLSTITAPVLWINSADDFINPPELGIAQKLVTRMPHAKFILIPISDATRGHGTHTQAAVWKDYLVAFLAETEKK